MLNSADFMTPTSFSPYTFGHQPGTSNAMAVAAATHNSMAVAAAYSLEAANSALIHSTMRPGPMRHDITRGNKRERTKFDQRQLEYMERFFKTKQYPDGADRETMAKVLSLTETKVQIWFKNRRAKGRAQEFQNKRINESIAARLKQSPNGLDSIGMKLNGSSTTSEDSEDGMKKDLDSPPPEPGQPIKLEINDSQIGSNEIKMEPGISCPNDGITEYSAPMFGSDYFEDQKDFKNFAATNYPFTLPTDPTAFTNNAAWMNPAYAPYGFGYFHTNPYYQNPVATAASLQTPQTAAATTTMPGYPDFYSNPYPSMPGLKDAKF
uniref:Homeobox domain-containing protein n=1 Tax=Panagrellus redivivus TaxID=6233 RepID=A0A7E4W8N8_PANRE